MQLVKLTTEKISTLFKVLTCLLSIAYCQFAKAQDNSPYSRYAIGDLVPSTNIANRGMGRITQALAIFCLLTLVIRLRILRFNLIKNCDQPSCNRVVHYLMWALIMTAAFYMNLITLQNSKHKIYYFLICRSVYPWQQLGIYFWLETCIPY